MATKKLIFAKFGKTFLIFLANVYLPSIQFPQPIIEKYVTVLEVANPKDLKIFVTELIENFKKENKF